MAHVLVTGAAGFVGNVLCPFLMARGHGVRGGIRKYSPRMHAHNGVQYVEVGNIESADWANVLPDIDTIVHLAARVHVMNDKVVDPLVEYRKTNVLATRRLAG